MPCLNGSRGVNLRLLEMAVTHQNKNNELIFKRGSSSSSLSSSVITTSSGEDFSHSSTSNSISARSRIKRKPTTTAPKIEIGNDNAILVGLLQLKKMALDQKISAGDMHLIKPPVDPNKPLQPIDVYRSKIL